ncbi:MAG: hypothetical protein K2X81_13100 [Candidatus Obscuribacterales bacterium]|nr:hypothetical protein [Candidatus Obscuribacterales bacterium]
MTDNANKPGDQRNDRAEHRPDKASERLSKGAPEVNNYNLRAAQKANPNRTDTVSPDGKSRFSLSDDGKSTEKQVRVAQEKAYKDAGLGDPHKPIGKPTESSFDPHKVSEQAAKALNKILDSGKSAVSEGAKLWQGAHNGMHEAVNETVQSVAVAKDYYGNALAGKVNLGADVKEFAGAISKGVSQSLGTAGDYYFRQVPKGEANLGKDIGTASNAASDHWNSLNTEQKGHFIGKDVVPLLVPGAVGVVAKEIQGANLVAKTGEAITAFSSSEKFAEIEQKMAQLQGHIQKLSQLSKPLEPAYATVSDTSGRPAIYAETPRPDDGILMMKGDKGLPQGIKPSEKVEVSRRLGERGHLINDIKVPEEVLKAAELQGLDRKVAQEKLQQVAESIKDAHYQIGNYDPKIHGTERAYGNKFHEILRQNLNQLGDKSITTEASYLKGTPSEWGKLGTSRVDISLGAKDEPFASVCLKTLKAVPSAQQERGWVRNLPKLKDGSVPPRLYVKLPDVKE